LTFAPVTAKMAKHPIGLGTKTRPVGVLLCPVARKRIGGRGRFFLRCSLRRWLVFPLGSKAWSGLGIFLIRIKTLVARWY